MAGDYIRFSPRNPDTGAPLGQQVPYFQRLKHGKRLTKSGEWVTAGDTNHSEYHIPQSMFEEMRPFLDLK